jgi:tetratricopeptide (TPR) repeat protein
MTTHLQTSSIHDATQATQKSHLWLKWLLIALVLLVSFLGLFSQINTVRAPLDVNSASGLTQRAIAYEAYGAYDQALQDYESALALDATYALAHYRIALLYDRWGMWDEAYAHYDLHIMHTNAQTLVPEAHALTRLAHLQPTS